jgi:hypothetical protein
VSGVVAVGAVTVSVGGGAAGFVTTAVAVELTGSVAATEGVSTVAVSEAAGATVAVSTWAWAGRLAGPNSASRGMSDKLIPTTVIRRITISTRDRIMPYSPEARPIRPFLNFPGRCPATQATSCTLGKKFGQDLTGFSGLFYPLIPAILLKSAQGSYQLRLKPRGEIDSCC